MFFATAMVNSSDKNGNGSYSSAYTPSNSADDRASFASTVNGSAAFSDGSIRLSGAYSDRGSTRNGGHHHGGGSSRGSGSGSDFYSEDDSDNSEGYADAEGHQLSATQRSGHQRHTAGSNGNGSSEDSSRTAEGSRRDSAASPTSRHAASTRRHQSTSPGVNRMSATDAPLSYFHRHSRNSFSIQNELRCYVGHLKHVFKIIEEDRLPWQADFADIHKLRLPRKMKEVAGRLNLNIPYYASNYVEVFYVVTMPFLFVYNTPFFLVTFVTMVMIHSVTMRRKNTQVYGESVTVLGRPITYRNLAHILLFAFAMLFMFFNGLRTLMWVVVLNVCVIVPHAVIRKPTYFDDEELEKCRPKLAQYAIVLLLLALDYLEGDVGDNDDTESRRLVERERKRLAAVLEKREGKE